MKISELIRSLQLIQEGSGDLDVVWQSLMHTCPVEPSVRSGMDVDANGEPIPVVLVNP